MSGSIQKPSTDAAQCMRTSDFTVSPYCTSSSLNEDVCVCACFVWVWVWVWVWVYSVPIMYLFQTQ